MGWRPSITARKALYLVLTFAGAYLIGLTGIYLADDPVPLNRAVNDLLVYLIFITPPVIGTVVALRRLRRDRTSNNIWLLVLCGLVTLFVWTFEWFLLVDNCGAGGGCEVFREWSDGKAALVASLAPIGITCLTSATLLFVAPTVTIERHPSET